MFKKLIVQSLIGLNFAEGIIHIVTSMISFWGIYDTNAWDWRIMAAPTCDLFLGFVSLVTSVVLKKWMVCGHSYEHV